MKTLRKSKGFSLIELLVVIAIIGRDKNILETQQNRLRGGNTTTQALEQFTHLKDLAPTHYISQELFFSLSSFSIKLLS